MKYKISAKGTGNKIKTYGKLKNNLDNYINKELKKDPSLKKRLDFYGISIELEIISYRLHKLSNILERLIDKKHKTHK